MRGRRVSDPCFPFFDRSDAFARHLADQLRNAAAVLREGLSRVSQGDVAIDCSALAQVDSAARGRAAGVATRRRRSGQTLALHGVPPQLASLATLYGWTACWACRPRRSPTSEHHHHRH